MPAAAGRGALFFSRCCRTGHRRTSALAVRQRQWLSTAPNSDTDSGGQGLQRKYMYGFAALLVAANVFTVWQEIDAHDEEAYKLKMERQLAWEKEQAELERLSKESRS